MTEIITRSPRRSAHNGHKKKIGAPLPHRDGMDIDDYSGVLLDFREWCVQNKIDFRASVMKAVTKFKKTYVPEMEQKLAYGLLPPRKRRRVLTKACCANEKRNINGGCDSCGDPCL